MIVLQRGKDIIVERNPTSLLQLRKIAAGNEINLTLSPVFSLGGGGLSLDVVWLGSAIMGVNLSHKSGFLYRK